MGVYTGLYVVWLLRLVMLVMWWPMCRIHWHCEGCYIYHCSCGAAHKLQDHLCRHFTSQHHIVSALSIQLIFFVHLRSHQVHSYLVIILKQFSAITFDTKLKLFAVITV